MEEVGQPALSGLVFRRLRALGYRREYRRSRMGDFDIGGHLGGTRQ